MIEIIPNWHPVLVHFTVGLLFTAVFFYLARSLLAEQHPWRQQWLHMANWSLWSGCLFTAATVLAGIIAFNTVDHDSTSHTAMSLHRNWALPTAALFIVLGITAVMLVRKQQKPGWRFLSFSAVAAIMLLVTAYLGAEVVYRHGIGVMALPETEAESAHHNHNHSDLETDQQQHNHDNEAVAAEPEHKHDHNH
jgi:uncharacterized membrane protein